jgi:hypothetical protein
MLWFQIGQLLACVRSSLCAESDHRFPLESDRVLPMCVCRLCSLARWIDDVRSGEQGSTARIEDHAGGISLSRPTPRLGPKRNRYIGAAKFWKYLRRCQSWSIYSWCSTSYSFQEQLNCYHGLMLPYIPIRHVSLSPKPRKLNPL